MRFRKKPVVIDAVQWTGENVAEIEGFVGRDGKRGDGTTFKVFTLEGPMTATLDDWIIRGIEGEHYPCKPRIFEETYEAVEDAP